MTKKEESVSYVKIGNPVLIRTEILNAAIEATYILKFIENYKNIRAEKIQKMHEINKIIDKIGNETSKLKRVMPREDEIHFLTSVKPKIHTEEDKKPKKEVHHLDPLDKELLEIKRKLDSIKI